MFAPPTGCRRLAIGLGYLRGRQAAARSERRAARGPRRRPAGAGSGTVDYAALIAGCRRPSGGARLSTSSSRGGPHGASEEGAGRWQALRAPVAQALAAARMADARTRLRAGRGEPRRSNAGETGRAPNMETGCTRQSLLERPRRARRRFYAHRVYGESVLDRSSAHGRGGIRAGFGDDVAALVAWLTKPDPEPGETEDAAKERYFARFAGAPERVLLLEVRRLLEQGPTDHRAAHARRAGEVLRHDGARDRPARRARPLLRAAVRGLARAVSGSRR